MSNAAWRCRELHPSDLERIVQLVESVRGQPDTRSVDVVELLDLLRGDAPSAVAVVGDEIVGVAAASLSGSTAWVQTLAIADDWRHQGIGSALIARIESMALHRGAFKVSALLGEGQIGESALRNRGFRAMRGLVLYEKHEPVPPSDVALLDAWGGDLLDPSSWDEVSGMHAEKELLDRRIIGPLADPALARRIGVLAPSTAILFGPPGTGKTTFARAIAGVLGWPFVELLPSKLTAAGGGLAAELRRAFEELAALEHVVVFIDEFDEIAPSRLARPEVQGVVNELLKAIPGFRSRQGRLLIAATNYVAHIDPAVLRPGRFDLIIPIGPPDEAARAALWTRALASMAVDESCAIEPLVARSIGFTPGDVALAAQRAASAAFHRARTAPDEDRVTSSDLDAALASTPASLSPEVVEAFAAEVAAFSRV